MKKMNLVFIKTKAKMGVSLVLLLFFMFLGSVSVSAQSNPKPADQVFDLITKEISAAKEAGAFKWQVLRGVKADPAVDANYLYFRALKNALAPGGSLSVATVNKVYTNLKVKYDKSKSGTLLKAIDATHQRALGLLFD